MKKFTNNICKFVALAIIFAMILPINTFAYYEPSESGEEQFTVNGVTYKMWSTTYHDSRSTFRGSTWVMNIAQTKLPTGHMGVATYLCNANDESVIVKRDRKFNDQPAYWFYQETEKGIGGSDGVITKGTVWIYDGTRYKELEAPMAPTIYPASYANSAAMLDENGNYPVTASGKTYGSLIQADFVGYDPDLIFATGTNGTKGYIRSEDLNLNVSNPEEAMVYMAELENKVENYRMIPLYDLNENIIGDFKVDLPTDEVSPEAQEVIDRLEQDAYQARMDIITKMAADKPAALPWAEEHIQSLVMEMLANGGYLRNSKGETYGSTLLSALLGGDPELIKATGTKGELGYIRMRDTIEGQFEVNTPEDAMRYMAYLETQPDEYLIPLYDFEGNVIGEFLYGCSSESALTSEMIYEQLNKSHVPEKNQAALGQSGKVPDNVIEEYIDVGINTPYEGPDFYIELNSIAEDSETISSDVRSDNTVVLHQADNIPDNVIEEYIDPVEIEEGVYEYRDSEGTLLATMYEDPSKMPNVLAASAKTEYSIDLDVAASSWAHTDDMINQSGFYKIVYSIDFARELPAYLGRYYKNSSGQDHVAWMNHIYSKGIYASFTESGTPFYVAIKNMGNKSNIYTGTVTVS